MKYHQKLPEKKMSDAHLGHKMLDTTRQKIRQANIGNTYAAGNTSSIHHKKRTREANIGNKYAAKLTEEAVLFIKKGIKQGTSQVVLAEKFGVTQATISDIKSGKTWNCVSSLTTSSE